MGNATKKQIEYAEQIAQVLGIDMPKDRSFDEIAKFISDYKKDFFEKKDQIVHDAITQNVQIVSYAQELGYTLVRKGKYYTLKEHDSVRIDPEKNCFWRNSIGGDGKSSLGGSVIDFAVHFSGQSIKDVMQDFAARVEGKGMNLTMSTPKITVKERDTFNLPPKAKDMRRVYAYLIKSRYLDTDIVQEMVDKKMLYQDLKGNCVFVSYDKEQPVFACLRGTNTEKRFVGDVANCNYSKGFYIDNHSDKLIVTESVINAMSIMSILNAKGIDHRQYDYMPMAGASKFEALVKHLHDEPKKEIYLALDNDESGRKNSDIIKQILDQESMTLGVYEWISDFNDWNDELREAFRHGRSLAEIDFGKNERIKEDRHISYLEKAKKEAAKAHAASDNKDKRLEMDYDYD